MTSMSVGEAAQLCGVRPNVLRYYERVGLLDPVGRDGAGRRVYDDDALATVRFILLMRDTGMPLRALHEYLELSRRGERTASRRRQILEEQRQRLRRQRARVDECLAAIERKISACPRPADARAAALATVGTGERG